MLRKILFDNAPQRADRLFRRAWTAFKMNHRKRPDLWIQFLGGSATGRPTLLVHTPPGTLVVEGAGAYVDYDHEHARRQLFRLMMDSAKTDNELRARRTFGISEGVADRLKRGRYGLPWKDYSRLRDSGLFDNERLLRLQVRGTGKVFIDSLDAERRTKQLRSFFGVLMNQKTKGTSPVTPPVEETQSGSTEETKIMKWIPMSRPALNAGQSNKITAPLAISAIGCEGKSPHIAVTISEDLARRKSLLIGDFARICYNPEGKRGLIERVTEGGFKLRYFGPLKNGEMAPRIGRCRFIFMRPDNFPALHLRVNEIQDAEITEDGIEFPWPE